MPKCQSEVWINLSGGHPYIYAPEIITDCYPKFTCVALSS